MIRRTGPQEAERLARIHAGAFERGWSAGDVAGLAGDPRVLALAATAAEDAPVGFILVRAAADEAEILTLAVSPDHRRRGLARQLLAAAAGAARGLGARRMFLEVSVDNAPALGLYRGLGFVEVGRRPDYYRRSGGGAADAAVLEAALPLSGATGAAP